MMTPLTPWALVTGGANRGGAAMVRALHAKGMNVVVHHTKASSAKAHSLQTELETLRAQSIRLWQADFSATDFLPPPWLPTQGITVLVLNASVYQPSGLSDANQYARDYAVHVQANINLLTALEPSGQPESTPQLQSVVAITDMAVDRACVGYVSYNATKGALQSLILTLATNWAPKVRCNVVQPGTMPYPPDWQDDERSAMIEQTIPLKRIGTFEELASAVVFLALDATYVTGQVLAVDGGRSRHMY
jgi:pteridine reductase